MADQVRVEKARQLIDEWLRKGKDFQLELLMEEDRERAYSKGYAEGYEQCRRDLSHG